MGKATEAPRLRLLVVSDAIYPWHKGGKEVRYNELLPRTLAHNIDVELATMRWWTTQPADIVTSSGRVHYRAICNNYPLYKGHRRSIRQAVLFAGSTMKLLRTRCDVIEADHMPYLQLIPLRLVASLKRTPLVVTWHEYWGVTYWREYMGPLGLIGAAIEWLSARLPHHIVAVNHETQERLHRSGLRDTKVSLVSNAINLSRIADVIASDAAPDILFVGRLLVHKRADLALRALASLIADDPSLRLGIVGVGPEEADLRHLAMQLGIRDHVVFYGEIETQDTIWSLMKGARVVLCPSEREGFGMVVAEALASGTAVVVSDAPDNASQELVTDGVDGSIVVAGDADGFAKATRHWLDNPRHDTNLYEHPVLRRPEFNWDTAAASYAATIQSMVNA